MAKVLLILGILLALAGAGLGFMNFQKKNELTEELDTTKQNLTQTEGALEETKKELTETASTLETTQEELKTTTEEKEEVETQLATAQQDLDKAKTDLAEKEKRITELASVEEDLEKEEQRVKDLTAEVADLTNQVADKDEKIAQLEQDLSERPTQVAAAPDGGTEGIVIGGTPSGQTTPVATLNGRVEAVNAQWGFVVVDVGEKDGVNSNAKLDVLRGGSKVGQIRIAEVEPTYATADIAEGDVQPGDRVVLPN